MINMTKPGIGSEKTETIPVKAKRTPNIQLSIKPTEIFLLGVVCSLIVLKLVNKKCQNFPCFYFFTKENFAQLVSMRILFVLKPMLACYVNCDKITLFL